MKPLQGPERLPIDSPVKKAVVFLHGLGSNGDDLISLTPMLQPHFRDVGFFAPNAPLGVPMTFNGWQWFELWDRSFTQIENGVRAAAPLIVTYIEQLCQRFTLTPADIVLVGFSQGTMMSLHTGLRLIKGLGGIIGFSGAMISPETLMLEKLETLPPVMLIHGTHDPVVPIFASQQATATITLCGGKVTLIERPFLPHTIDDVGINEAIGFIQTCFNKVTA